MNTVEKERERFDALRAEIEKRNIIAMSFAGESGTDLDYMENALDILSEHQDWIDENAKKKAEKYS
jgi:tRNA pseudouridine-54 N-methylase